MNITLAKKDMCWQRTDARIGGLLGWALQEIDSGEEERILISQSLARPVTVVPAQPVQAVKKVEQVRPPRTRLKHEQAVAIYLAQHGPKSCKTAGRLAAEFGITAKAVRDVWTKKTWASQTKYVWTACTSQPYFTASRRSAVAIARVERALQARPNLQPVELLLKMIHD